MVKRIDTSASIWKKACARLAKRYRIVDCRPRNSHKIQPIIPLHLFDLLWGTYYIGKNFQVNGMPIFAPPIKSWDFRTIVRCCLLPMAIVLALFLPPLLLSFILTFVLTVAIKPLRPYSWAFLGRTLPGCRIDISPRGPPVS
jgi:hypothetical protein